MIWLMFNWLAHKGNDRDAFVRALSRNNEARWQAAFNLANALCAERASGKPKLTVDPQLAEQLAEILDREIEAASMDEHPDHAANLSVSSAGRISGRRRPAHADQGGHRPSATIAKATCAARRSRASRCWPPISRRDDDRFRENKSLAEGAVRSGRRHRPAHARRGRRGAGRDRRRTIPGQAAIHARRHESRRALQRRHAVGPSRRRRGRARAGRNARSRRAGRRARWKSRKTCGRSSAR